MTYPPLPPDEERPVELEGAPAEENLSTADAVERVEDDPREQRNLTDERPDALAGDVERSQEDPATD